MRLAKNDHRVITEIFPMCTVLWQQQVLVTISSIIQWRRGMGDATRNWSDAAAKATHRAALHGAHRQLTYSCSKPSWHPGPRMLADLLKPAPADPDTDASHTSQEAQPQDRYLLFFDGGSRGNPGRSGAGAVIVAESSSRASASIVWSASMSYASPRTTNNLAEYWGVVTSLTAAKAGGFHPLEVIGDSALILGQLRQYRPPVNRKLLPLYAAARRLADQLAVEHWHHHLGAYNKMADHAANVAMDLATSLQLYHPTTRTEHLHLQTLLRGDFQHWQETASRRSEPAW